MTSQAILVTYDVRGNLDLTSQFLDFNTGDAFTVGFTYDTSTPGQPLNGVDGARYDALLNFYYTLPGYSAGMTGTGRGEASLVNATNFDELRFDVNRAQGLSGPTLPNGYRVENAYIGLRNDLDTNTFTSNDLPGFLNLNRFTGARFGTVFVNDAYPNNDDAYAEGVSGEIDTLRLRLLSNQYEVAGIIEQVSDGLSNRFIAGQQFLLGIDITVAFAPADGSDGSNATFPLAITRFDFLVGNPFEGGFGLQGEGLHTLSLINNGPNGDELRLFGDYGGIGGLLNTELLFRDPAMAALATAFGIPGVIDLDNFDFSQFIMNFENNQRLIGSINSLDAANEQPVIPEPATLALLSLGLGCAGFTRRLRSQWLHSHPVF